MEIRRFKDIVAFSDRGIIATSEEITARKSITAFHTRNLEVAEITEEAFNQMAPLTLKAKAISPEATIPKTATSRTTSRETTKDQALSTALDELIKWSFETNPDVKSGKIDYGIRSLALNVTQICNLKCTYCAAGGDGTYGSPVNKINVERTLPQIKFFMDRLPQNSAFNISFVGGEPLLYPEAIAAIYDYVVNEAKSKNTRARFMITTNGTLITDKVIEILKERSIHLTISLDGDSSVNDQRRPTKNGQSSTELTLTGIKKLQNIRSSLESLGVSAVFSKDHLDVVGTYQFFKTLDLDWYEFNFSYTETSEEVQKIFLNQMEEVARIAWVEGQEIELRKIKTFNLYFDLLDRQQQVENFCGAGKSFLMIDAKNQISTCPWEASNPKEVVGKAVETKPTKPVAGVSFYSDQELEDALNKNLERYQKPLIELNDCQSCWARYLCGGGCMYINKHHTGDKHRKNKLFCDRTRHLILVALSYYKKARSS